MKCWPQNRTLELFLTSVHLQVYIKTLNILPTHSTPVQPYFLSLRTDNKNDPSHWLRNIPHYSATKKNSPILLQNNKQLKPISLPQ